MPKMHYVWQIFFNSANTTYLFSLMCLICPKSNEAVLNLSYSIVFFTINTPLEMLPWHFWYFLCSNFKMTFDKFTFFLTKSDRFLTCSKLLLCHKILLSGIHCHLNDYQKYHLNNSWNLPKCVFCQLCICKL